MMTFDRAQPQGKSRWSAPEQNILLIVYAMFLPLNGPFTTSPMNNSSIQLTRTTTDDAKTSSTSRKRRSFNTERSFAVHISLSGLFLWKKYATASETTKISFRADHILAAVRERTFMGFHSRVDNKNDTSKPINCGSRRNSWSHMVC